MPQIPIKDIIIKDRYRKDMRDLDVLVSSIELLGQMQPIAINAKNVLIFGERRIRAFQQLGRETIDAVVFDVESPLQAEHDENVCRADFTVSERVAISNALLEEEKARAKERMADGGRGGHLTTPLETGKSREIVAKKAGFSSEMTMRRAAKVVNDALPEVVEAMDMEDVSVSAAYEIALMPKGQQLEALADIKPKTRRQSKPRSSPKPPAQAKPKQDNSRLYADNSPISARQAFNRVKKEIDMMGKDDPNTIPVVQKIIEICQEKLLRLTGESK